MFWQITVQKAIKSLHETELLACQALVKLRLDNKHCRSLAHVGSFQNQAPIDSTRLPLWISHMPSSRQHEALNRGTSGGS